MSYSGQIGHASVPKSRRRWVALVAALLISLLLHYGNLLRHIENDVRGEFIALTQTEVESDLVLVEIDAASLRELSSWPWPRSYYARVLRQLRAAGAEQVFFDIDFSARREEREDADFIEALSEADEIPIFFPAFIQWMNSQATNNLILTLPLDKFSPYITPVSVNLQPDDDGLVREIQLRGSFAGIDLVAAPVYMLNVYASTSTPARIEINYRISPASFERASFYDVYQGNVKPSFFDGKKVIVGATALELGDKIPVPVHRSLPGPVVQAIAYESLRQGMITLVPTEIVLVGLLAIFLLYVMLPVNTVWRRSLLISLVVSSALLVTHFWMISSDIYMRSGALILAPFLFFVLIQLSRIDQQVVQLLLQRLNIEKKDILMSNVVNNSGEGIITIDQEGMLKSANPAACIVFSLPEGEYKELNISRLIPSITPGFLVDQSRLGAFTLDESGKSTLGVSFPVEFSVTKLDLHDQPLFTVFARDVSARVSAQKKLQHQATHDFLTGLHNRHALLDRISENVSLYHSSGQCCSLLFIDMNRFKEINDTLGHSVGDEILVDLGKRLSELSSDTVFVSRIGGDEFAVLVSNRISLNQVENVIRQIEDVLHQPVVAKEMLLRLGASIGVAHMPEHTVNGGELLTYADVAMYYAKENKLGFSYYNDKLNQNTLRGLAISSQLATAIEEQQFVLHYQPKVDMKSGRLDCFEVLIRWIHPELGRIAPDEFIGVAEASGMIKPITFFCLREAKRKYIELAETGCAVRMAVNLSALLLQDVGLIDELRSLVSDALGASWLELEITESAIFSDPDVAIALLHEMRALGIKLSIDDFGTGYAGLVYLKSLPVDELKIDKYFIDNVLESESNQIILKSTIDLSHSLGISVVCEGVETDAVYQYLVGLRCDYAQGYWISRPLPAEDISLWLIDWQQRVKAAAEGDEMTKNRH